MTNSIKMDNLTENEIFPEVSENAIEAVKAKQNEIEQENSVEINQEQEKPKLKKDGTPAKKRGRKAGVKNQEKPQAEFHNPREKTTTQKPQDIGAVSSIEAVKVVSGILESMQVHLISSDFIYNEVERDLNVKAWANTFDHYGGVNLTPPQALALNHASIILSRVGTSNETRTKLQLVNSWFRNKIAKFRNRKKDKNAYTDIRSDYERENDIRSEKSSESQKAGT